MYDCLFKRYKDQNPREIFAHFGWWADISETWETPLQKLAVKGRKQKDHTTNHQQWLETGQVAKGLIQSPA